MHLGALLSRLEGENDVAAFLAGIGDVMLLQRVEATAAAFDETSTEYVTAAVRRYAGLASSDDWLAMMTTMEKAEDPGRAAIAVIIEWAVRADQAELAGGMSESACSCGGH